MLYFSLSQLTLVEAPSLTFLAATFVFSFVRSNFSLTLDESFGDGPPSLRGSAPGFTPGLLPPHGLSIDVIDFFTWFFASRKDWFFLFLESFLERERERGRQMIKALYGFCLSMVVTILMNSLFFRVFYVQFKNMVDRIFCPTLRIPPCVRKMVGSLKNLLSFG